MPGMTKRLGRTNRVEFRLPPDLDAEVRAECARLGWNITEWGERACRSLLSELAAVPSEGIALESRSGASAANDSPDPIGTGRCEADAPSAPSQGRDLMQELADSLKCGRVMVGSGTDTYDPVCELAKGHRGGCKSSAAVAQNETLESGAAPPTKAGEGEDARVSPARLAAPRRAQLGNVGPKPLAATKPRPKAAARKTKP